MFKKIKEHKKLTIVILVIILVAGVGGFFFYKSKSASADSEQMNSGTQAFKLTKQDMSSSISTSGTVESANVVEVTTDVTSPVKELKVALGDYVEKGQVLCTFDGEEIKQQIAELENQKAAAQKADQLSKEKAQRAVDQAKAQVAAKAATVEEAKKTYEAVKQLVGGSDTSGEQTAEALVQAQQALQAAQSEYEMAQQNQQEAQYTLDTLGTSATDNKELNKLYQQLNHLTVVAEQSGLITQLNVSKGSIPSGPLMKIEDDKNLVVKVNIKEKDILKLSKDQKASIKCDAIGTDETFKGTVDKVINFASSSTSAEGAQTSGYSATVVVEPGTPLLLGMSVKVEILLNEEGEHLAVPYDAIAVDDDGNSYVYVAKKQDNGMYKVKRVDVTTGTSNDYYTAVSSKKLKENDVIINYPMEVSEGDEIEIYIPEEEMDLSGEETEEK